MSIYKALPLCCSVPGPEDVDGIGNFYLHILAPAPSQFPVATLYFFDTHGEVHGKWFRGKEYERITAEQTEWFRKSARANQATREQHNDGTYCHHSLAFVHIPLPVFADDSKLQKISGRRREPTEGSDEDSGLYHALAEAGIGALACGHDHVNDFVARPRQASSARHGPPPYLLYPGTPGYGGYCSYNGTRYPRRVRVYRCTKRRLATWLHVEYEEAPVDEIVLVDEGKSVHLPDQQADRGICVMS